MEENLIIQEGPATHVAVAVTAEEARHRICHGTLWQKLRPRRSLRMEIVYVPYFTFQLQASTPTRQRQFHITVDAILGYAIGFSPDALAYEHDREGLCLRERLSPEEAYRRALHAWRWAVFSRVLKHYKGVVVTIIGPARRILYPYWLVYFQRSHRHDFGAVDGVTGLRQGLRMRRTLMAGLVDNYRGAGGVAHQVRTDKSTRFL